MRTYSILSPLPVLTHHGDGYLIVADHDEHEAYIPGVTALDVAVRSGDYLATLATRLDTICHQLSAVDEPEHAELQRIIDELLSIDAKYQLAKRSA